MRSSSPQESFGTTSNSQDSGPLGEIIHNRDTNGCIVKWSVELGEFEIEFCPREAIKSQILADYVSEWTEI
jgi:hypothetical protein